MKGDFQQALQELTLETARWDRDAARARAEAAEVALARERVWLEVARLGLATERGGLVLS